MAVEPSRSQPHLLWCVFATSRRQLSAVVATSWRLSICWFSSPHLVEMFSGREEYHYRFLNRAVWVAFFVTAPPLVLGLCDDCFLLYRHHWPSMSGTMALLFWIQSPTAGTLPKLLVFQSAAAASLEPSGCVRFMRYRCWPLHRAVVAMVNRIPPLDPV